MRQHHCPFLSCCKLLITWVSSDVPFPYACLYIIRNSNKLQSKSVGHLKCIHHNVASQVDRNIKLLEIIWNFAQFVGTKIEYIILSNYIDTPICDFLFIYMISLLYFLTKTQNVTCFLNNRDYQCKCSIRFSSIAICKNWC